MVRSCTGCRYKDIPGMSAALSCKRAITVRTSSRWFLGLRLICMRPLLSEALLPSTPMKDDTLSTAGSFSTRPASSSCMRDMAENDTDCCASLMAWIAPVSCRGKKPLGTMTYSTTILAMPGFTPGNGLGNVASSRCRLIASVVRPAICRSRSVMVSVTEVCMMIFVNN